MLVVRILEVTMLQNSKEPTDQEIVAIQRLIDEFTLAVFQRLNKTLNARNLMLSVTSLRKVDASS